MTRAKACAGVLSNRLTNRGFSLSYAGTRTALEEIVLGVYFNWKQVVNTVFCPWRDEGGTAARLTGERGYMWLRTSFYLYPYYAGKQITDDNCQERNVSD